MSNEHSTAETMLNRRAFLKLAAFATASSLLVPAFNAPRKSYVSVGEVVDYIGPRHKELLIGWIVERVGEWDQIGYPVSLYNGGQCVPFERRDRCVIYDFNLCVFNKDVPSQFWRSEANSRKYPNVHSYVREQRFGESVQDAMKAMGFLYV